MVEINLEYDRPASTAKAETNSCSSHFSCCHAWHLA
jgi:hypothetical protein